MVARRRRSRSGTVTPRRTSRRSTINLEEENQNEALDVEYTDDNIDAAQDDDELEIPQNEESEDDEDFKEDEEPIRKRSKRFLSENKKDQFKDLDDSILDDEEEEVEAEVEDHTNDPDVSLTASGTISKEPPQLRRAKRGRPPLHRSKEEQPAHEEVPEFEVLNDEFVLPLDEDGETKINKDGELLGDREYKVRTFKVPNRGNRLYMLSTEPARCVGFRDSYLLFQKHKRLHKIVLSSEEKFDLIERELIPSSYKGRTISLVTARGIFMEFGAKVVVGGKYITDDYYVKEQKAKGFKEGEFADPADRHGGRDGFNNNQLTSWNGSSTGGGGISTPDLMFLDSTSAESMSIRALRPQESTVNEENWMLVHAQVVRETDSYLLSDRNNNMRGVKDSYTGITFVPQITQPTKVKYLKEKTSSVVDNEPNLSYKTVIQSDHIFTHTGLKNVDLSIFDGFVSSEIKEAILKQQNLEKNSF